MIAVLCPVTRAVARRSCASGQERVGFNQRGGALRVQPAKRTSYTAFALDGFAVDRDGTAQCSTRYHRVQWRLGGGGEAEVDVPLSGEVDGRLVRDRLLRSQH